MAPKHYNFKLASIKFPTKSGKTTFPKEIFHKIWLIIGDCTFTLLKTKLRKSYSVALLLGKQILKSSPAKKNANLCYLAL